MTNIFGILNNLACKMRTSVLNFYLFANYNNVKSKI